MAPHLDIPSLRGRAAKHGPRPGLTTISAIGSGREHWVWACLTFPFVLAWRSVRIYLLPMLYVYVGRVLGFLARSVFHGFECFFCYKFVDKSFPPELACQGEKPGSYDWVRLSDLRSPDDEPLCLFRDGLEPDDINQGALGDCWLMAATSALARNPAAIRRLFVNTEINDRGKYQIRLYHRINDEKHGRRSGKRITVTVDDFIPVRKGTKSPVFAQISDRGEIWVLLLEKAFAKIWSHEYDSKEKGYEALSGGRMSRALYHMTGDTCWTWTPDKDDPKYFQALEMYSRRGGVVAVARFGGAAQGIVSDHAYSVVGAYRAGTVLGLGLNQGTRLVKVRNPWGSGGEWKGPWGDGTKEWDENPHIAKEVGYVPGNDGTFFMTIDDFCDVFRFSDFCDRTTKDDLVFEYNEKPRHLGPLLGCLSGCASFWFLCRGARTIYLGNATSEEPPDVEAADQCCVRVIPDCVLPDHIRYVAAEQHAQRNNRT